MARAGACSAVQRLAAMGTCTLRSPILGRRLLLPQPPLPARLPPFSGPALLMVAPPRSSTRRRGGGRAGFVAPLGGDAAGSQIWHRGPG